MNIYLQVALLLAASLNLLVCLANAAQQHGNTSVDASRYREAPMLAEQVRRGLLPAVDQRLPDEPLVVGPGVLLSEADLPQWTSGRYGGTLRTSHYIGGWNPDVFIMLNEPLLAAPGISVQGLGGNVLKDFEVNTDHTVFTFYMRRGLKWSDGQPVTTEDVRFVYEDIFLNSQLTKSFPTRFRTGGVPDGDPMQLEVIDDTTFRITFSRAYGSFLRQIAIDGWVGYTELIRPAHYLKQFHAAYTPGLPDDWWTLFWSKDCSNWSLTSPHCIDFPVLTPWRIISAENGTLVFERNPFYFKVDATGLQLPYIDRIESVQVADVNAVHQRVLNGYIDFMRESASLDKLDEYRTHAEQGGYRVVLLDSHVDPTSLWINQTFNNSTWRSIVQDVRFRQALSLAINRQAINSRVYAGLASMPSQTVGTVYSEYNPNQANSLLDTLGLNARDDEDYRLAPNGSPFTIELAHGGHTLDIPLVADSIAEDLRAVGLRTQVRQLSPSEWGSRWGDNELQATVMWSNDRGSDNDTTTGNIRRAGPLWAQWHTTNGQKGEEPPLWIKQIIDLAAQLRGEVPGSTEYNRLYESGLEWHRANLPIITVVERAKQPLIVSQRLRNIPSGGFSIAANFAAEQLYYVPSLYLPLVFRK